MQKDNVTISVMGQTIYTGPWNPEKIYKAEYNAFLTWADKEGEDLFMAEYVQDAQPVVEEVSRASVQMQEFFWKGSGGWHGPGLLLQEELEGYLMRQGKLEVTHGVSSVVA